MSGHTPGPWIIEAENPNDIVSHVHDVEICNIQPVDIGGPKNFNYGSQTVANANLIMVAPDLLAQLEEAASMLGERLLKDTFGYEWYEKTSAAIARAKGEQL